MANILFNPGRKSQDTVIGGVFADNMLSIVTLMEEIQQVGLAKFEFEYNEKSSLPRVKISEVTCKEQKGRFSIESLLPFYHERMSNETIKRDREN